MRLFWHAQVVSAACRALASLARSAPSAATVLAANAGNYLSVLRTCQQLQNGQAFCPRRACT
jgi:hypothetical protein